MKRALWIIQRDLKKFRRAPTFLVMTIIMPLIFLVFIGNSFGREIEGVNVAYVNDSDLPAAQTVYGILKGSEVFSLDNVSSIDAAEDRILNDKAKAYVHVSQTEKNPNGTVFVAYDNSDILIMSTLNATMVSLLLNDFQLRALNVGFNFSEELYPEVDYIAYVTPGIIIMAIFMSTFVGGGIVIVVDRQRGIMESYMTTPLKTSELVTGITFSGVFKATVSASIALIVAALLASLALPGGILSLFTVYAIILLISFGLMGLSAAIATRVQQFEAMPGIAMPINLTLFFTSGAIAPIQGYPAWMQEFSKINPMTYAVHAIRVTLLKGSPLGTVGPDALFLAIFALLMLFISARALKRTIT